MLLLIPPLDRRVMFVTSRKPVARIGSLGRHKTTSSSSGTSTECTGIDYLPQSLHNSKCAVIVNSWTPAPLLVRLCQGFTTLLLNQFLWRVSNRCPRWTRTLNSNDPLAWETAFHLLPHTNKDSNLLRIIVDISGSGSTEDSWILFYFEHERMTCY